METTTEKHAHQWEVDCYGDVGEMHYEVLYCSTCRNLRLRKTPLKGATI
jgi:hypothetical protein